MRKAEGISTLPSRTYNIHCEYLLNSNKCGEPGGVAADLHAKRKDWSSCKMVADLCVKQNELVQYHRELTIYIVNTFLTQTNAVSMAASPRICRQSGRIGVHIRWLRICV